MERTHDETDEGTLAKTLIPLQWPTGWACPCGSTDYHHLRCRPRVLQCAKCRKQQSITARTILHRTRLPLHKWFRAIEMFVRTLGISARKLAVLVGVHVETAWQMLHRIRVTFDGGEPLLTGLVKRCVVAIGCRGPRIDPVVECAVLAGVEGQVRIVQGSPCVDPALGGSTKRKPNISFDWKHHKRGGDPASVGTMRHEVDLTTILGADAQLEPMLRSNPEIRIVDGLERRLRRTYREVSQRWLARYLGAFAALWRLWTERGGPYRAHDDKAGMTSAVLTRCLARPRATFTELTPCLV